MWTGSSGEGLSGKMTLEPISAGVVGSLPAKSERKNIPGRGNDRPLPVLMIFRVMLGFPGLVRRSIGGVHFQQQNCFK